MNKNQKMVEVYAASNELEAQIIQDVLKNSNIPSVLLPSISIPSAYSPMQIHGTVKVMVMDSMAERAREIIMSDNHV